MQDCGVNIEPVDANDEAAFAEWFRPFHAAECRAWPDDPGWAEHELRVLCADQSEAEIVIAVARDVDGTPVGCLDVSMPSRENLDLAYVSVSVDPAHERRGVGRALLEHGEQVAQDRGRSRIFGHTLEPVDSEPRGASFARAASYRAARTNERRDLHLPVSPELLDDLTAACLPFAAGYEIVTWTGSCPGSLAEGRVHLAQVISADAPHGELDYEVENWDIDRLRRWEANVEQMGRDLLSAGAVESASGTLVGFTELGLPRRRPQLAYQFDTVVSPEHRGHRLGALTKIANVRALAERSPETRRMSTWNAADNAPMIGVNEAIGYARAGILRDWQKDIA
ncbi:MAG: GNAT family N-acetyltransferase [Acidimicrobiales bacterium]